MPSRVVAFPSSAVPSIPKSGRMRDARRYLESLRQSRLCDCPFKTPYAASLDLIEEAGLGVPSDEITWDQVVAVCATVPGVVQRVW